MSNAEHAEIQRKAEHRSEEQIAATRKRLHDKFENLRRRRKTRRRKEERDHDVRPF